MDSDNEEMTMAEQRDIFNTLVEESLQLSDYKEELTKGMSFYSFHFIFLSF